MFSSSIPVAPTAKVCQDRSVSLPGMIDCVAVADCSLIPTTLAPVPDSVISSMMQTEVATSVAVVEISEGVASFGVDEHS